MRAFVAAIRAVDARAGARVTRARASELDRVRVLAVLGIARTYFRVQRFVEAAGDRVGRRSPAWAEPQVGAAWADFYASRSSRVLERIAAVRKRRPDAWVPEAAWLEVLAEGELVQRRARWHPPGGGYLY